MEKEIIASRSNWTKDIPDELLGKGLGVIHWHSGCQFHIAIVEEQDEYSDKSKHSPAAHPPCATIEHLPNTGYSTTIDSYSYRFKEEDIDRFIADFYGLRQKLAEKKRIGELTALLEAVLNVKIALDRNVIVNVYGYYLEQTLKGYDIEELVGQAEFAVPLLLEACKLKGIRKEHKLNEFEKEMEKLGVFKKNR
jgi:hypothetical protein